MSEFRKLRVFLCHASQDKPAVRRLYQKLMSEGWIDPWLDKESLLPGQTWEMEIERAIESTDAVIVFLSNRSVTKEGYVQKELHHVLSIATQKPEGTIFVIPLRLEDCLPPPSFQSWQYLDYFPKNHGRQSYTKLLNSLKLRANACSVPIEEIAKPKAPGRKKGSNKREHQQIETLVDSKDNFIKTSDTPVVSAQEFSPFIFSRALSPKEFSGRSTELNRIANRLTTGQSIAIIGQPHMGKTSLLNFIATIGARQHQWGNEFEKNCFVFLDVQAARGIQGQADFWKYVLMSLNDTELASFYDQTAKEGYNNFVLEQVFISLKQGGYRLVLLLDEFDTLLSHPVLHNPDFYGGLRSLASRTEGLVLVIATRRPLEQLNQLTQDINPHGSPFFNIFVEIQLGALKPDAFSALLDQGGDHINTTDRLYIERVSGRHPYLAQAAAAMLWDAHDDKLVGKERYDTAGHNLYHLSRPHFADTWRFWSNTTRKAVTAVALAEIPHLLGNHQFKVSELVDNFDDFTPELDLLQDSGTLTLNDAGEWVLAQDALLWWLADELRRRVREDAPFDEWLHTQEMDNLLTKHEKQLLNQAAKIVLSVVGKGATTLIESLAKGFGEASMKM